MEIQLVNTYFKDLTLNNCNMEREIFAICTLASTSSSRLIGAPVRLVWIRRQTSPRWTVEAWGPGQNQNRLSPATLCYGFLQYLPGGRGERDALLTLEQPNSSLIISAYGRMVFLIFLISFVSFYPLVP